MKLEFTPFGAGVAVQPDPRSEMVGSIHRPDTSEERSCSGRIVATGPDVPPYLWKGQRVVYSPYSGTTMTVAGVKLFVMMPGEVLGMVPEESTSAAS